MGTDDPKPWRPDRHDTAGGRLAGRSVECVYWMFGTHDGMVIIDVPDSVSAAAMSITAGSSGAFKTMETHELLTQEQLGQVLSRSKDATQAYQPPGQQG